MWSFLLFYIYYNSMDKEVSVDIYADLSYEELKALYEDDEADIYISEQKENIYE